MIAWFRRKRPAVHVQQVTRGDIETAYAWGLTLDQWYALTDTQRAERRRDVTHAPRFGAAA